MGDDSNNSLPSGVADLAGLAAWENMAHHIPNRDDVGEGFVRLIDYMGSDLTVVNAARVSFNKRVESVEDRDEKLIKYLIEHEHTSPLRHGFFTFHVRAPMFVLRQWGKHQVGCSWNEVSLRYVRHDMGFWEPSSWRKPPEGSAKQGSSGVISDEQHAQKIYDDAMKSAKEAYDALIDAGVCNEQARAVLPMSLMTEFWWTASLQAVLRFLDLRLANDAQSEIRDYAEAIEKIVQSKYPVVLNAWRMYTKYV